MNVLSQLGNGIINNLVYGAWDLSSFLTNATKQANAWGGGFLTLIGTIAIVVAAYQIISGLMSHGKKQVNWGVTIILLLVGGALATTGLGLVTNIAKGGKKTIEDLGNGAGANLWLMLKTMPWF